MELAVAEGLHRIGPEGHLPEHPQPVDQHIVEIVSDSGEGAQTAGQLFGSISARMGNGVWTVEIIPAEIEPPPRSRPGASGNRIRLGRTRVTNSGDTADVMVAFNEQVLFGRIDSGALRPGSRVFMDNKWATDPQPEIRQQYAEALEEFRKRGYLVQEIPLEEECKRLVPDPRRGKNMWTLGLLCSLYQRDMNIAREEVKRVFSKKKTDTLERNWQLVQAGYEWANTHLPLRYQISATPSAEPTVVMNGNQAVALGLMAAGIDVVSMYPITPATSATHYLAGVLERAGGFIHQAEDEIAAVNFAIGASYAGRTAATVTSGPGLALKTEALGLAVMAEIPLVVVVVQRGGPSTGLPTKVEQGDLLASMFGQPGDAPKIVMAPSTIAECFEFMIEARKLAETYRGPVIVLTDANLATGQQPFPRPDVQEKDLAPPIPQSPWPQGQPPYAWDPVTGLSPRPIPGQLNGIHVVTGLAHDEHSHVAYESGTNQRSSVMRSRKLATFFRTLRPPKIYREPEGDLLVVGWGSTRGAIEEAVDRVRDEGKRVSALHLRFLSPLEPGLREIFSRFKKVLTVEINYSDDGRDEAVPPEARRYGQLAWLLRGSTLVDVDCWTRVPGHPLQPSEIENELRRQLDLA
ncbi:MAG: 2-oxoacid:acceptor oxidoreductase subunit alpha [Nitrospirae bacterium]|nr:2-oxoacid:acceptor oxidoreductase subunit alpha [Nitrospirota bacterium]